MRLSNIALAISAQYGGLFSPSSLFTSGVNGAWYDPSDLSTLFQDAAGTIPVTAMEQPVGLMLDKSKGLVLGSELVTNGDFSNGTTGWTARNGTISATSGVLRIDQTTTAYSLAYQAITCVIGKWYKLTITVVTPATGGSGSIQLGVGTSFTSVDATFFRNATAAGTYDLYFAATATTMYVRPMVNITYNNVYAEIDNISVRELPGNHAFNASGNSANFPVLKQDETGRKYLSFNGTNQWLQTNSIDFSYGDKMFVCAGARKLVDTGFLCLCELGTNVTSINGSFSIFAPDGGAGTITYSERGTAFVYAQANNASFNAPLTFVASGVGSISAPNTALRVNGTQVAQSTTSQGTGNFSNYPLYLGARAGTSLFFNGRLYGLVVAGKQASAGEISSTESYLNQRTGAY